MVDEQETCLLIQALPIDIDSGREGGELNSQ